MSTFLRSSLVLGTLLCAPSALAAESFEAVSGAQGTLTGRIEGATVVAKACRSPKDCTAEARFTIPKTADAARAKAERVDLAGAKKAVLITVPARDGKGRWVLVLAAASGGPPAVQKLLGGFTDRPKGELEGERKTSVLLREDAADGDVLVLGHKYENATVCGRPAIINARALDPESWTWKPTQTRTLSAADRSKAQRVTAKRMESWPGDEPQLLTALVASSAVGRSQSGLTDGKLDTRWAAGWQGAGRGEFVVLNASKEVSILGFELVIRPTAQPEPPGAAPKQLLVATDTAVFQVVMPEDAWLQPPGTGYRVDLPSPVASDCVTVIIDDAYTKKDGAPISITELRARTPQAGKGGDFAALAKDLDAESERADAARALLLRSGPRAVAATLAAYDSLGPYGRRRALDVIDGGECPDTVGFFVDRMLGKGHQGEFDPDTDRLARHAREQLSLCRKDAAVALAAAVEKEKGVQRVWAARQLAAIAPPKAFEVIVPRLDTKDDDERRGLRAALALAARQRRAQQTVLQELAPQRFASRPLKTRIDLLRALDTHIGKFAPARAALAQILKSDRSFRTRYLVLMPAAELAASGDREALAFVQNSVRKDKSAHIRAHAALASGKVPALSADTAGALRDRGPRVREAALEAMALSPAPVAPQIERRIAQLLASDRWTFVRVGAARALGAKPRAPSGDQALMAAVSKDGETATVRAAALTALGQRKSTSAGELVHDVAADAQEPLAVRIAAVDALGSMCRRDSAALLYKLALRAGYPELPYDQQLGMAALAALGAIKPPDVALKLAPLLSRDMRVPRAVRMIARDVLIRPGTCR